MSIGSRISTWWRQRRVKSSSGSSRPEAVRSELDEAYRRQTQLLTQVRRSVADVSNSRRRVEFQLAKLRAEIDSHDSAAAAAVSRGDDVAARESLTRKVTIEKAAEELTTRRATLKADEDTLTAQANKVERQIEDFRVQRDTLTARYTAATARAELNSATTGIASAHSEIGQTLAEAERHTRELDATADAIDELVADGIIARPGESADDALARRIDAALQETPTLPEGDDDGPHQISQ